MSDLIDTSKEEKKQDKSERRRERELADIRFIIKSVEGRRFYWRLMADAGVFRRSFNGDTVGTMFNEGRRSLGLDILNDLLEAKPAAFSEMQQEYASEKKREDNEVKEEIKESDPLSLS